MPEILNMHRHVQDVPHQDTEENFIDIIESIELSRKGFPREVQRHI